MPTGIASSCTILTSWSAIVTISIVSLTVVSPNVVALGRFASPTVNKGYIYINLTLLKYKQFQEVKDIMVCFFDNLNTRYIFYNDNVYITILLVIILLLISCN